jgi:hypothetical protein
MEKTFGLILVDIHLYIYGVKDAKANSDANDFNPVQSLLEYFAKENAITRHIRAMSRN